MFSIIIPTFNNLEYLKLCIKSIKKNSIFDHELIIHINEGSDGTLDFVKNNKFKYSFSEINAGVCTAFNEGVKLSNNKYIVLAHDDMYFCPGWDKVFFDELSLIDDGRDFFLSGTMVQPFESYLVLNCGKTYKDFNEKKLLNEVKDLDFYDFQGTHWQPSLIPKKTWDKVNGFSLEFSPGLGSDPDFNMKLWKIGVRLFKGLSKCRVYHFSSISLRKKAWNNGAKTFIKKWGFSIKFFKKYYLMTDSRFEGELQGPKKSIKYYLELFICKLKLIYYILFS